MTKQMGIAKVQNVLRNVGIDATLDDCQLFLAINNEADDPPLTATHLETIRNTHVLPTRSIAWATTAERTSETVTHLLRGETGRKAAAKELLQSAEGRHAVREEMKDLSVDELRDLLGLNNGTKANT